MLLFPEGRPDHKSQHNAIHVRLNELQIKNPRQWGACWLFCELWNLLELDRFWIDKLLPSRKGTRWLNVFKTLTAYRLIDPGSEWRLHRLWYEQSAMGDLLGEDFGLVQKDKLYRCLDKLIEHKEELFSFLRERWKNMFNAKFDVLLYDLTSTCFECDPPGEIVNKETFTFSLNKDKLRKVMKKEGKYLLRSNLTATDPGLLWKQYMLLGEVEQAFKEMKGDLLYGLFITKKT